MSLNFLSQLSLQDQFFIYTIYWTVSKVKIKVHTKDIHFSYRFDDK